MNNYSLVIVRKKTDLLYGYKSSKRELYKAPPFSCPVRDEMVLLEDGSIGVVEDSCNSYNFTQTTFEMVLKGFKYTDIEAVPKIKAVLEKKDCYYPKENEDESSTE